MSSPASIGVLIPTRNSVALLPGHLDSVQTWIDLAEEVVVVDSQSRDGTLEMIQSRLRHPRLKFLSHPPGLYQSWNFGIQNLGTKYTYIATVGDYITREGLQHLHAVAEELACDVVVSKPAFVDSNGHAMPASFWPIDDIIGSLSLQQPRSLERALLFLFVLVNCTGAILGSSASDLFRTDCLQRCPFPTDFGTVGDGAWGIMNAFQIRLGVTVKQASVFCEHPKSYAISEYTVSRLPDKLFALTRRTLQTALAENAEWAADARRMRMEEILRNVEEHLACQRQLEQIRAGWCPWSLIPAGWWARTRRGVTARRIQRLKMAALSQAQGAGHSPCWEGC